MRAKKGQNVLKTSNGNGQRVGVSRVRGSHGHRRQSATAKITNSKRTIVLLYFLFLLCSYICYTFPVLWFCLSCLTNFHLTRMFCFAGIIAPARFAIREYRKMGRFMYFLSFVIAVYPSCVSFVCKLSSLSIELLSCRSVTEINNQQKLDADVTLCDSIVSPEFGWFSFDVVATFIIAYLKPIT